MARNETAVSLRQLAGVLALATLLAACGQKQAPAPAAAPAAPPEATVAPAAATASEPAAGDVQAALELTPEVMEALLAPIALYPDPVLAQVLTAATNPQMVLDGGNWLIQNPDLKGKALDEAAEPLGFSPSMRALLQFPEVVDMMCMELDWTTQLGEGFNADQAGMLDAVQRLRKQSAEVGNLKSGDQLKVETEVQEGKEVITVEPANPAVVYVPKYDPVAVYAPPPATIPAPTTTTVVEQKTGFSTGAMVTTGLLSFGAGLLVAEVFDDDDDWDNYSPNYGYGGMYYGGRPYYPPPPSYYRPNYGGSYRPGSGYNRPPGYGNSFNNNTIIVNNQGNDYWDSFDKQPRASGDRRPQAKSPISTAKPNRPELATLDQDQRSRQATNKANPRPRPATSDKSAGWQGQDRYAGKGRGEGLDRAPGQTGAFPPTGSDRARTQPGQSKVQGSYAGASPEGQAAREKMTAGRPAVPGAGGSIDRPRPTTGKTDRGYAGASQQGRAATDRKPQQAAKPAQQKQQSRQAQPQRQPEQSRQAPPQRQAQGGARPSSGFSGSKDGGNARASSQRGRQSMPQGARSKGGTSKGGSKGEAKAGNNKGRR